MGVNCDSGLSMAAPVRRPERSKAFVNWTLSIAVTASDGERFQRAELNLVDGWSQGDEYSCVEGLAMTAAGLIKMLESSGLPIYGGDAVQGFTEAYQDKPTEEETRRGDQ